jgi:hypothetical protein
MPLVGVAIGRGLGEAVGHFAGYELREGVERLAGLVLIVVALALIALELSGHRL